jgi:succinate dehydrogenase / fumarate reductase flavoprotein subunit/L-aspartate oxidase
VYPTLHYQNGGVAIDRDGATSVDGLYCVGEVSGGIHGRNRLMGNALLDILSMGRRAGAKASQARGSLITNRAGIGHVHAWQRELTLAGLPLDARSPQLFPGYANFQLKADAALGAGSGGRMVGGIR